MYVYTKTHMVIPKSFKRHSKCKLLLNMTWLFHHHDHLSCLWGSVTLIYVGKLHEFRDAKLLNTLVSMVNDSFIWSDDIARKPGSSGHIFRLDLTWWHSFLQAGSSYQIDSEGIKNSKWFEEPGFPATYDTSTDLEMFLLFAGWEWTAFLHFLIATNLMNRTLLEINSMCLKLWPCIYITRKSFSPSTRCKLGPLVVHYWTWWRHLGSDWAIFLFLPKGLGAIIIQRYYVISHTRQFF